MAPDALPKIRVVSAEITRDGRYLITQRKAKAVLPLLWEFPGGRVRDGETDAAALQRCLSDRIGVAVVVHDLTMETVHAYESYALTMAVYRCSIPGTQDPKPANVEAVAWVRPEDFGDYPFPGADQATVDKLVKSLD
ncbi:MAG: (deoxy)nucleoside triphosphate pyrophosphohydrolase [Alphaproteobacteria bacterium]|nr:(deoxy)nucleoside triphosphate pyrophosphohydrolase [Alphaproteobacteria bacterium]